MVYPVECCRACFYAKGKKCNCSCNGKYHGKGLTRVQIPGSNKRLVGKKCVHCGIIQPIDKIKCGLCGKIIFEKVFV